MKKRVRMCWVVSLFFYLVPIPAGAEDWIKWRGPHANGISMESEWDPYALASPRILWQINVGEGHSQATVQGDRIYTMGSERIDSDGSKRYYEVIYSLDTTTGAVIWKYSYPTKERTWPGPAASVVVDDSLLYSIGREGDLYCLVAENGKVKWQRNLVSESLAENHMYGFAGSPVVVDDLVILNAGQSGIAFEKKTGAGVWRSEPVSGGIATPVLFTRPGKQQVAISSGDNTYIVEARTGKVLWTHPWAIERDPLIWEQNLFLIGLKGSTLLKMNTDTCNVLWQNRNKCSSFQSWVEIDGYAYGMGMIKKDHVLQCIDLRNGDIRWLQTMPEWGSLIAADKKLIILDGKGDVIIVEADANGYREISRAHIFKNDTPVDKLQQQVTCWTNPVLSNKRLYVRNTRGDLVSIEMRPYRSAAIRK